MSPGDFDKSYPTNKENHYWIIAGDWFGSWGCCAGSGAICGGGYHLKPSTICVKGSGGFIICQAAAEKAGKYGVPPPELMDLVESKQPKIMQTKIDKIKVPQPPYSQSYWKIAEADLSCIYGCNGTVKAGSIYLDRMDKGKVMCVGCVCSFHPEPWIPTLSDFGVSDMPKKSKPKKEFIAAKESPINASKWAIATKDLTCWCPVGGCTETIKAGEVYLLWAGNDPWKADSPAKYWPKISFKIPSVEDFSSEVISQPEPVKSGDPTAVKGWIWLKPKLGDSVIGLKCWQGVGGCGIDIEAGKFYAVDKETYARILCLSCAAAKGHGSPDGLGSVITSPKKRQRKAPMICIKCGINLCEACGECETKGCRLVGRAICTAADLAKVKHLLAETQKVRGYVALAETLVVPKPYQIITEAEDITTFKPSKSKVFVRPCPVRPRHGFVESRLVDSDLIESPKDVVAAIFTEAKSADPQAELLIVPYVDSAYNMVITPTRLAIGAGNDGATAGKGSITVPLMGEKFSEITQKLYDQAGVDVSTEDPYFEAVVDKDHRVMFTQLRAGVKIPAAVGDDFIPRDMIVEEVIEASGDLLEWESQVKRIKSGTVVCHVGGTLTSHYGVHCLYNNIPVMTSRRPEVGEFILSKPKGAAPDPESIKRGLSVGINIPLRQDPRYVKDGEISCKMAIQTLLVALHNAGAMGEKDGFWVGFSAAIMQRVGMAASHGEARHKNIPKSGKVQRATVYKVALNDFFSSRETLGAAQWSFQNLSWGSGYGGPKWAKCTEATIELDAAIREFLNDPTDFQVGKLITKLNNAVNQAHNGGWWLNKFVDVNEFDRAAAQSINLIAQAGIGMFRVANSKFDDLTGSVERWRVAPPIVVAEGEILAYAKVGDKHDPTPNGIPTCIGCGKEYPQFIKYVAAINNGVSCDECKESVKFKLNGEWVEVEPEETVDGDSNCTCPLCMPQNHEESADDDDEPSDPPEPPEITKNTNVGMLVKIKPTHTILAAQGKWIKGNYFHIQVKTDASEGYYSYDLVIPSLNKEKLDPYANDWSWAGSGSHEYVSLTVEKLQDCASPWVWQFKHDDAGINFAFDPTVGYFKDNLNEQKEEVETSSEGIANSDETPF